MLKINRIWSLQRPIFQYFDILIKHAYDCAYLNIRHLHWLSRFEISCFNFSWQGVLKNNFFLEKYQISWSMEKNGCFWLKNGKSIRLRELRKLRWLLRFWPDRAENQSFSRRSGRRRETKIAAKGDNNHSACASSRSPLLPTTVVMWVWFIKRLEDSNQDGI